MYYFTFPRGFSYGDSKEESIVARAPPPSIILAELIRGKLSTLRNSYPIKSFSPGYIILVNKSAMVKIGIEFSRRG